MSHKKLICVIGSSNTDMVIKANRLPALGETVIGGEFLMSPVGKGATVIAAIWGFYFWKEFKGASKTIFVLLHVLLILYVLGLALLVLAR